MKVISPIKTALHGTTYEGSSLFGKIRMYAIIDMYAIILAIIS